MGVSDRELKVYPCRHRLPGAALISDADGHATIRRALLGSPLQRHGHRGVVCVLANASCVGASPYDWAVVPAGAPLYNVQVTDEARSNDRFYVLNGFLGLAFGDELWPNPLWEAGYRVAGIETEVAVSDRQWPVDGAVAHDASSNVILCEAKGASGDEAQHAGYVRAASEPQRTVITGGFPVSARSATVDAVYASDSRAEALKEWSDDQPVPLGVVEVSPDKIRLLDGAGPDALRRFLPVEVPAGSTPPRIVPLLSDSSDEEYDSLVAAMLIEYVARGDVSVSITDKDVFRELFLHSAVVGIAQRRAIERRIGASMKRVAGRAPDDFVYRPDLREIRLHATPEDAALQGRTQSYQRLGRLLGGSEVPEDVGYQAGFFDVPHSGADDDILREVDES